VIINDFWKKVLEIISAAISPVRLHIATIAIHPPPTEVRCVISTNLSRTLVIIFLLLIGLFTKGIRMGVAHFNPSPLHRGEGLRVRN